MISSVVLLASVVGTCGFFQFGDGGNVQFEFGGGNPFGGGVRKAPDATVEAQVSLEDFYMGKALSLSFQRRATCSTCKGTGAKTLKKCPHCAGRGVVRHPIHPIQQHCPHCGGEGKIAASRCSKCNGQKLVKETVNKEVVLPAGAADGHAARLPNLADDTPGAEAGDVVVALKASPHATFSRSGTTLRTTTPISLGEALLGFHRETTHLDGRTVEIATAGASQHLSKLTLRNEGMPTSARRTAFGALEVTVAVKFPSRLSTVQVDALRTAFPEEFQRVENELAAAERAEPEDVEEDGEDDEDDEE